MSMNYQSEISINLFLRCTRGLKSRLTANGMVTTWQGHLREKTKR